MPQIEFTKPNPPTFKVIDQAKLYLIFLGEWTYPAADDIVTSLNKILGSTYLDDFATDYKVKKPDYLGKTFDRSPLSADEPRRRQIEEIVKHNLLPATKKPAQGEL